MPPPSERLGLLFSATLSYRVTELAYEHMNNPELVKIEKRTLIFRVSAEDEKGTIGDGEHVRIIVNVARFDARGRLVL